MFIYLLLIHIDKSYYNNFYLLHNEDNKQLLYLINLFSLSCSSNSCLSLRIRSLLSMYFDWHMKLH